MRHVPLQLGGIPFESVAQLAVIAGTLVLVLMLVALGAFAYRSVRGDGVEWPDDREEDDGVEGVSKNHGDDEWKYS